MTKQFSIQVVNSLKLFAATFGKIQTALDAR